jgi:hypothetical protein
MLEGWIKPKLFTKATFQQCEYFQAKSFSCNFFIFLSLVDMAVPTPTCLGLKGLVVVVVDMAVKMTSLVKENFYCPGQDIYWTNMVEHMSKSDGNP